MDVKVIVSDFNFNVTVEGVVINVIMCMDFKLINFVTISTIAMLRAISILNAIICFITNVKVNVIAVIFATFTVIIIHISINFKVIMVIIDKIIAKTK